MKYKKIFIACDHAGLPLKKLLIDQNATLPWVNLGVNDETSVDYPDFADLVAAELDPQKNKSDNMLGVLICGSGQGMAIRANRFKHIRAALCSSPEIAGLSRAHNNANVLCIGARFIDIQIANEILKVFINTEFEGGRHERRVTKLSKNC